MKIAVLLLNIFGLVLASENGNLTIVRHLNKLYVVPQPCIHSNITNMSNSIPIQLNQHVSPQIRRKVLTEYKNVCSLTDKKKGCVVLPLPVWQVSVGLKDKSVNTFDTQWQNVEQGSTPHITLLHQRLYHDYNSTWIIKNVQLQLRSVRKYMIVPIILTMPELLGRSGTNIWNLISNWHYSSYGGPKPMHKQWETNVLAWIEGVELMKDGRMAIASECDRIQLKKAIHRAVNSKETLEAMQGSLDPMNHDRRKKSSSAILLNTTVAVLHENDTITVPFRQFC